MGQRLTTMAAKATIYSYNGDYQQQQQQLPFKTIGLVEMCGEQKSVERTRP